MGKDVTLTIDGVKVTVPEGTLIVNAAKMVGIDIPVFCYHPKMEPVGMCRMCLVEIGRPVINRGTGEVERDESGKTKMNFSGKLETACTTPVAEGMEVLGTTEKVRAGRDDILEFLLTSHPLDCPICDKGGECPLQNLTMGYGPGESRFIWDEKMRLAKHYPLGNMIVLDRERCIQCGRCVRFQDEIVDDPVIGFYQRGRALEIVSFSEPGFDSYFSGNTTDICPVGALTTTDFRFKARPWEWKSAATICNQCPVGCNMTANTRREAAAGGSWVVKRMMPRQNEQVNEIWICDKGRFGYHYAEVPNRFNQPMVRKNGQLVETTWEEALDLVAERFRQAGSDLLVLAGGRLANEDLFNLKELAAGVKGQAALYTDMAGGDLTAQLGLAQGSNFGEMGAETAILVVACDLEEEAPIWWLRVKQAAERGAQLIVVNPRATKSDRHATHRVRYPYGAEAATILAMVNSLSAKRPNLSEAGQALVRSPELQAAAKALADAKNAVILYGSEGLGLPGSKALAQACANLLVTTNHTGRPNNGLVGVWRRANDQGAWDLGFRPVDNLKAALGSAKAMYIAAADPAGDDPNLAEALGDGFLVVQELVLTATAKLADVVLPVQAYTEREGSYTNGERRVQRFYPILPELAGSMADFTITGQIGQRMGLDMELRIASKVMARIAARVPAYSGLSYTRLAEVKEQWPIIGRGDLYYGGTGYENSQGLGVKLGAAAESGQAPSLAWVEPPHVQQPENGLLAVPFNRLYDRGQTLLFSVLIQDRTPDPFVMLHPAEAGRLSNGKQPVRAETTVEISFNGISRLVKVHLDDTLPVGVVLVPRSFGIPVSGPVAAELRVADPALV